MKSREFIRKYITPAGGKLVKNDGDHKVYEFPGGKRMIVPTGGKHSEAQPYLVRRLQRILEGHGM